MEEAPATRLLAIAEKCIREGTPLFDLAEEIASIRGESVGQVLFGVCHNEGDTRRALKTAEGHAKRPR